MGAPGEATELLDAVRGSLARDRLVAPGDCVLVAVSGGADSVALLQVLTRLAPEHDLSLAVCHVDHGLQAESARDAGFVRDLATRLGWPVAVERVRVAERPGRSFEAAARTARYGALDRAARAVGARRIALGHTADDQAETVLMRLLQGAGPRGLAGIPVRRGRLIRPLLQVERRTILAYLEAEGLHWVEDPTNQDPKLLRNRIRHEVLPLLAAHGWPKIGQALRRTARAARESVEALDSLLAPRAATLATRHPGGIALDLAALRDLPPGAVKTVLRRVLRELPGSPVSAGLRAPHLDALAALGMAAPGARVRLPGGLFIERGRTALWILPPAGEVAAVPLPVPGTVELPASGFRLSAVLGCREAESPPDPADEIWLDAAAVPPALVVRAPRPGERLAVPGGPRPVRVARLLAEAGVAPTARRRWPLLVAPGPGGEIVLWIVGVRRGAAAPVTSETEALLRVRAVPGSLPPLREDCP
jgi:tRNA(Ile)-lysidine synthase